MIKYCYIFQVAGYKIIKRKGKRDMMSNGQRAAFQVAIMWAENLAQLYLAFKAYNFY